MAPRRQNSRAPSSASSSGNRSILSYFSPINAPQSRAGSSATPAPIGLAPPSSSSSNTPTTGSRTAISRTRSLNAATTTQPTASASTSSTSVRRTHSAPQVIVKQESTAAAVPASSSQSVRGLDEDDTESRNIIARPLTNSATRIKAEELSITGMIPDESSPLQIISFRPVQEIETIVISSSSVGSPTAMSMTLWSSSSDELSLSSPTKAVKNDTKGKGKAVEPPASAAAATATTTQPAGVTMDSTPRPAPTHSTEADQGDDDDDDEWASVAESLLSSRKAPQSSSQAGTNEVFATPMEGVESVGPSSPFEKPFNSVSLPVQLQRADSGKSAEMDISSGDFPPSQSRSSSPPASPTRTRTRTASITAHQTPKQVSKTSVSANPTPSPTKRTTPRTLTRRPSVSSTPQVTTRSTSIPVATSSVKSALQGQPSSARVEALSAELTATTLVPATPPRESYRSPIRKTTTSPYIREPSGSPLSPLPPSPSPLKLGAGGSALSPSASRFYAQSSPSPLKRTASLGITSSPRKVSRTNPLNSPTASSQRSPSQSGTGSPRNRAGIRPHSFSLVVPVGVKRQPSASPVKNSKAPTSKPVASAPAGPTTRRRATVVLAPISDSDSSESDDGGSSVKSSPQRRRYHVGSDTTQEDDAAFEAAMERVRLRKENNEMLVPVASTSSTPAAATDSGVDVTSVEQPRRSSRTGAARKTETLRKKTIDLSFMDVKPANASKLAAIVRERKEKERSGKASAWLQSKQLLEEDDGDLGRRSDSSDEEEERKPGKISLDRVDSIANVAAGITNDHDEAYSQYMASPEKRKQAQAAQARKEKIARTLREDATRIAAGESRPDAVNGLSRRFWLKRARMPPSRPLEADENASPWYVRIVEHFNSVRQNPFGDSSISLLRLFSRVAGYGQEIERQSIAKQLLSFVCHPSTPDTVATCGITLLDHMIRHSEASSRQVLTYDDLQCAMHSVGRGAGDAAGGAEMNDTAIEDADDADDAEMWDEDKRVVAVRRMLAVAQSLASARCATPSGPAFAVMLLELAIDPSSAQLRDCLESTLSVILSSQNMALSDLNYVASNTFGKYRHSGPQIQLEVLRAVSHDTERNKLLRKCIALAWLIGSRHSKDEITVSPFSSVAYDQLRLALQEPSPGCPFHVHNEMDDRALYLNAQLLSIALTNLGVELYSDDYKQARLHVSAMASALGDVEKRIRTDVRHGNPMRNRAKNALTRLSHSLQYQLKASGAAMSGFDVTMAQDVCSNENDGLDDDDEAADKGRKMAKRVNGVGERGQTLLAFRPVPKAVTVKAVLPDQDPTPMDSDPAPATACLKDAADSALAVAPEVSGDGKADGPAKTMSNCNGKDEGLGEKEQAVAAPDEPAVVSMEGLTTHL